MPIPMSRKEELLKCHDCGAEPGRPHQPGCDTERCSVCGGQRLQCDCPDHDPLFARWTGIWPGKAEADYLGITLNDFVDRDLDRMFFVKPMWDIPQAPASRESEPGEDEDEHQGEWQAIEVDEALIDAACPRCGSPKDFEWPEAPDGVTREYACDSELMPDKSGGTLVWRFLETDMCKAHAAVREENKRLKSLLAKANSSGSVRPGAAANA